MDKHKPKLQQFNLSTANVAKDFEIELQNMKWSLKLTMMPIQNVNNAMKQIQPKHMHYYGCNAQKACKERFWIQSPWITKDYKSKLYEMAIILDSIKTMVNTKQKENESLQDYTKQFKTACDVMCSHIGGPMILTKFVKKMKGYDATNEDKVAEYQFIAYTYRQKYIWYIMNWSTHPKNIEHQSISKNTYQSIQHSQYTPFW
jgi:hypothetical protein